MLIIVHQKQDGIKKGQREIISFIKKQLDLGYSTPRRQEKRELRGNNSTQNCVPSKHCFQGKMVQKEHL